MAKRRTPPLFEVLSTPDRRPGPGAMVGRPVQVMAPPPPPPVRERITEPPPSMSTPPSAGSAAKGIRVTPAMIWLGVAAFLLVVFTVWPLAFKLGERKKLEDVKSELMDPANANPRPETALKPTGAGDGNGGAAGPLTPGNPPETSAPPIEASADPRKAGNNYLHIVSLPADEADKAVAYLTKNGVPAAAVPDKKLGKIDPATARANNRSFLVFALEPVPSDQYKTMERRRLDLIEKVRTIGKKWQREEKGPSDFGSPGWSKFQ